MNTTPVPKSRREVKFPAWAYCVILYVLIVALVQGGWSKAGSTYLEIILSMFVAIIAISIIQLTVKQPIQGLATVLAIVTIPWFYYSGSYRYGWALLWDILGLAFGIAAIAFLHRTLSPHFRSKLSARAQVWWRDAVMVLMIVAGWAGISILSVVRESPVQPHPERFSKLGPSNSIVPDYAGAWSHVRIGVALSGGGYRAAVFHAGVLHALENLGIRINVLSTVSGGSITGAFYAIGGDPVEFKDAVKEGRFNLKRRMMLLHNAVRLPFPLTIPGSDVELGWFYHFSRLDVQTSMLRSTLFGAAQRLREPKESEPELLIATTDLAYGLEVGLLPDGIVTLSPGLNRRVYRGAKYHSEMPLDLARRVAVSGAFPVVFPSEKVKVKVIPCTSNGYGTRPLLLADGGIADNSGVDLLLAANNLAGSTTECLVDAANPDYHLSERWKVDAVIASDAGAIFGVERKLSGVDVLSRAFDITGEKFGPASTDSLGIRPIFISAQQIYLPAHAQFLLYNDQPEEFIAARNWHVEFDPRLEFPTPVLHAIVDLLPGSARDGANQKLSTYLQAVAGTPEFDPPTLQLWRRKLEAIDAADCRQRLKSGADAEELKKMPGFCEAASLREIVGSEIRRSLEVFKRTSTLEDWPRADDVEAVFRLGQLLTYTRWLDIRRQLDSASAGAPGS